MTITDPSDLALIHKSLELAAEQFGDISPLVYKYFYATNPQASDLFGVKAVTEGRMFYEVLGVVLDHAEGRSYVASNLDAEVRYHKVYGVTVAMYQGYFNAIVDAMSEALGQAWTTKYHDAWQRNLSSIMKMVSRHATVHGMP